MQFSLQQQTNRCTNILSNPPDYPSSHIKNEHYNMPEICRYVTSQMATLTDTTIGTIISDCFCVSSRSPRLFGSDDDPARADIVHQGGNQYQIQIQSNRGSIPAAQYTSLTFASLILGSSIYGYLINLTGVPEPMRLWPDELNLPEIEPDNRTKGILYMRINELINSRNETVGLISQQHIDLGFNIDPIKHFPRDCAWQTMVDYIPRLRRVHNQLRDGLTFYRENKARNERKEEVGREIKRGLQVSLDQCRTYNLSYT